MMNILRGKTALLQGTLSSSLGNGCYGDLRVFPALFLCGTVPMLSPRCCLDPCSQSPIITVGTAPLGAPMNLDNSRHALLYAASSPKIWAGSWDLLQSVECGTSDLGSVCSNTLKKTRSFHFVLGQVGRRARSPAALRLAPVWAAHPSRVQQRREGELCLPANRPAELPANSQHRLVYYVSEAISEVNPSAATVLPGADVTWSRDELSPLCFAQIAASRVNKSNVCILSQHIWSMF